LVQEAIYLKTEPVVKGKAEYGAKGDLNRPGSGEKEDGIIDEEKSPRLCWETSRGQTILVSDGKILKPWFK